MDAKEAREIAINSMNEAEERRKVVIDDKFIRYIHHGKKIWVRSDLKGLHSEYCLCYSCSKFHPNKPTNCPIAQATLEHDQKYILVTPVWECAEFNEVD